MSNNTSAGAGSEPRPTFGVLGTSLYYSGMEKRFKSGRILRLIQGDITTLAADAIVNAANSALAGGGGVDGAIHQAGGPSIMEELKGIRAQQGGCPTGEAVVTTAGKLPAQYVFHAVGPIYAGGQRQEADLLRSCYKTCLALAAKHQLRTISFPSISTGAYGYPVQEAAALAMDVVVPCLMRSETTLQEVTFVLFDAHTLKAYERALSEIDSDSAEGNPVE